MTTLVTGVTGLVGARLFPRLVAMGGKYRALVRGGKEVPAGATAVEGDLLDPASLDQAVAGVSAIIHLAAGWATSRSLCRPLRLPRRCRHWGTCIPRGGDHRSRQKASDEQPAAGKLRHRSTLEKTVVLDSGEPAMSAPAGARVPEPSPASYGETKTCLGQSLVRCR